MNNAEFIKLFYAVVCPCVREVDAIEEPSEGGSIIIVKADDENPGVLIGRGGNVCSAARKLCHVRSSSRSGANSVKVVKIVGNHTGVRRKTVDEIGSVMDGAKRLLDLFREVDESIIGEIHGHEAMKFIVLKIKNKDPESEWWRAAKVYLADCFPAIGSSMSANYLVDFRIEAK